MDRDGNGGIFLFSCSAVGEWAVSNRISTVRRRLDLVVPDRPGCGQSGYFDKEGFNEARNLQCPVEGCAYVWCKKCQQEVVPSNGPEHSCDGSSAQTRKPRLQRGWTFGFSWSSIRTRVDVNANVRPGDIRVQLVSTSYFAVTVNKETSDAESRFQAFFKLLKLPVVRCLCSHRSKRASTVQKVNSVDPWSLPNSLLGTS